MKYILFLIAILIFIYDLLKNNNKNSIENFKIKKNNINNNINDTINDNINDNIDDNINDTINNKNNCIIKSCKLNNSNYDSIHPHFFSWNNLNLKY